MRILAIDTSCDDTCIAIIEAEKHGYQHRKIWRKFKVISNIVSSQVRVHRKYGGVYPILAKREHQRNLVLVLKKSLEEARLLKLKSKHQRLKTDIKKLKEILKREEIFYVKLKKFLAKYRKPKIDVVAVTIGPGLEPCLWTGVNFAKALSYYWDFPIIPVNHIESHIFVNFLYNPQGSPKDSDISSEPTGQANFKFYNPLPAICLVVSGGHTQLILMRKIGSYKIIGETRDDAAGECFDKTARILGLGYPGGPAIAAESAKLQATSYKLQAKLPRPMINSKDYDFSFSGLKTAVLYDFKKRPKKVRVLKEYVREMAKEIQQAIVDVLIKKTIRAAKDYKVKTIILGGGVAANKELDKQFKGRIAKELPKTPYLKPKTCFCTDNAAMVGTTAYYHLHGKRHWKKIKAQANLRINDANV